MSYVALNTSTLNFLFYWKFPSLDFDKISGIDATFEYYSCDNINESIEIFWLFPLGT